MTDPTDDRRRLMAERLDRAGLAGVAFDVDEIATDYESRLDMDRSLDALIGHDPENTGPRGS